MGQHSPEDVPNVYKQRGTWAIDTVRLMIWGELRGLSLRQRAQFYELLCYYLHSFTVLVYVPSIIGALLGYVPFAASGRSFLVHMLPIVLATEAWLLAINRPYNDRRRRQRHPVRELWRVRIIWSGMAPVFMKASIQAILGGPNRKPVYKVTRKHNDPRWHWGHTLPQTSVLLLVGFTLIYAVRRHDAASDAAAAVCLLGRPLRGAVRRLRCAQLAWRAQPAQYVGGAPTTARG
jgi:cellulose synthase (UDP-forming)